MTAFGPGKDVFMTSSDSPTEMTEERASELVWSAIEQAGGSRSIYRNPRMAFASNARRKIEVGGITVDIRYGEISTPAVVSVEGWVFEVHDEDIELLMSPTNRA
jgi:hypothetical protein